MSLIKNVDKYFLYIVLRFVIYCIILCIKIVLLLNDIKDYQIL
jgi:hypothetical protein